MGAGASAANMAIEDRRELYKELRNQYTRSDLDQLDEKEKQAWLEVIEERKEADAAAAVAEAQAKVVAEAVAKGAAEFVQNVAVEEEAENAAGAEDLATPKPEEAVRSGASKVAEAAEAAAARTSASGGRKSGWDLSGKDDTGIRPQNRKTRLSYLLAAESDDDDGVGECGGGDGDGNGRPGVCGGKQEDACLDAADAAGVGGRRHTAGTRRSSAELPAWKKSAEAVETANELCIGDIVRARDMECNGMWFEGVLTAIHDESTFEVELSGDDDEVEGEPQRITVGINDVVRVMPWFCIEVGDMVECQPEGTMSWIRGTVVDVDLSQALYHVALESDDDDDFVNEQVADRESGDGGEEANGGGDRTPEYSLTTVPDSRIRKIVSGRQEASKRWKKVYLASCLTGLGRWISSNKAE